MESQAPRPKCWKSLGPWCQSGEDSHLHTRVAILTGSSPPLASRSKAVLAPSRFYCGKFYDMKMRPAKELEEGAQCKVIGGTHEGKSGTVRDIKTGKTGHASITVVQSDGTRFKTLAKNVTII
jgi:hypothetical protein